MNAYFAIEPKQVCALSSLMQEQIKWLEILSSRIPQSSLTRVKPDGVNLGLFTFSEFRAFISEIGYSAAVSEADALYRP